MKFWVLLIFGTFITSFTPVISKIANGLGASPAALLGWVSLIMSGACFGLAHYRGESLLVPISRECLHWTLLLSAILTVSVFLYYDLMRYNAIRVVAPVWALQAVFASVWACMALREPLPWSAWVTFAMATGTVFAASYHR